MHKFQTVKYGDENDDVLVMQSFLHVLQYTDKKGNPLEIDGRCGEDTVYAINAFQTKQRKFGYECGTNGKNDGVWGTACWQRIGVI